ncbi:YecA family protein [Chloroflexota bacterium]
MKIGRNDPCWCGSGLKYKRCHLGRERQEPINFWSIAREHRKVFSVKECLVPESLKSECSGPIVNAHTVPRSESLLKIARDNHVYSLVLDLENRAKYKGRAEPELVGIKKASTFSGFCSNHDNSIFAPIERRPFIESPEQCFLLAYRAVAMELFKKKAALSASSIRRQTDRGKGKNEQRMIQSFNASFDTGVSAGLKDMEYHKQLYDKVLLNKDFKDIRAYVLVFDQPPPVMCSSVYSLEHDFKGNMLQDLNNLDVIVRQITYTSFYSEGHGFIVFSWLSESDVVCRQLIDSIRGLSPDRVTDVLIGFFFTFTENLHIQPEWWENLAANKRELLIDWLAESMNPSLPRTLGYLAGGINLDNWPLVETKLIGYD